ncbi:3-phosphoserine/phosphohydroxythreonine aminotransferase [Pedobacter sp. Leaf41]|uniref:3-phosphoserine/phosphohydroxythreonine transaminase n=1 Tax=Pedobacter sp. Leaf41 TaxID=1736218 RepID=UPI000702F62A|nr:3-phosphoserine/phosphohydroxythreonine transaminase [Pedobacter sp. Leaf41]KQN36140.1 3-phosphoserine/phosphohydroxythreonine aminotransferase [Pedobacter sp. Leaf41]
MIKKHNFGAGPCILPASVLEKAASAVINWNQNGLSILEVSHRSEEFEAVIQKTEQLVKDLMKVPDDYAILFLQGGASTQFSMLPLNFLAQKASYLDTGFFAQKAIKEARLFGAVEVVASSREKNYTYIPQTYEVCLSSSYLHLTSNNTIEGTEIFDFPQVSVPLICDMSSDIFSRVIDVSQFDLIYAGAQKNMGPAGMTLIIAKNSFLDSAKELVPSMSDYRIFRDSKSMFNTPPVFSIYAAMLNLEWLSEIGGVEEIEKLNIEKARLLYDELDQSKIFQATVHGTSRSRMNVTFTARNPEIESGFLKFIADKGIIGIRGYRTVGGFRVSLYNALPLASVQVLVSLMKQFEQMVIQENSSIII